MVGCVIGRERAGESFELLGAGHHRVFGGAHAEIEALECARRRGRDVRGATAWVTLEPCAHHGKTPPCAEALVQAGIARVVYGAADPGRASGGGAEALRAAGVETRRVPSAACEELIRPFAKRVRTGTPWVIAKWGQTLDGRIATRSGASQWITNEASRRRAHRLRARVDVILSGVGTVLADDPKLTARGVRRRRRRASRVVIDPRLETSEDSALVRSVESGRVIFVAGPNADPARARSLASRGGEIWRAESEEIDLAWVLSRFADELDATNVLLECGGGLMGRLLRGGLVDEVWAFVAPMALADERAIPLARGATTPSLEEATRFRLMRLKRLGSDALLIYRRALEEAPQS